MYLKVLNEIGKIITFRLRIKNHHFFLHKTDLTFYGINTDWQKYYGNIKIRPNEYIYNYTHSIRGSATSRQFL